MRPRPNEPPRTVGRWAQLLAIVPLTLVLAFCAGLMPPKTTAQNPKLVDVHQLWVEPANLESRDLLYGPGGPALVPNREASYELVAVDKGGYSPGYDVRDPDGTEWSVKLGLEVQPEIVTSRILWAIGYHQPPSYLLANWQLAGVQGGVQPQPAGRFRLKSPDQKIVSDWSWYENEFVTTESFRGLVVANLILNNWDWKTSNNKVYEVAGEDGVPRRIYVVRDLGASLGKTNFPAFLKWTPMRGFGQGSRNDLEGFEEQGFIKGVEGERVKFHYRGIHGQLVDIVTANDVIWTCRLMARLSDQQWRDAFRAAGYNDEYQQRYVAKIKSKINEGLALALE